MQELGTFRFALIEIPGAAAVLLIPVEEYENWRFKKHFSPKTNTGMATI